MTVSFTERGTPLADSDTLSLVQASGMLKDEISMIVATRLRGRGYADVSVSLWGFWEHWIVVLISLQILPAAWTYPARWWRKRSGNSANLAICLREQGRAN